MKMHERAMSLLIIFSSIFIVTLAVNGNAMDGLLFAAFEYFVFSALTDMGTPVNCK